MANTSLVSSVRDLFPDVAAAAEQYRRAKLDRESRNLARRLTNEEALYDQFMHKLWLVSSSKSSAPTGDLLPDIEGRLGGHSAVSLVDDLRQMEEFLRSLKADLVNTSRGTEVLAKLRHKTTIPRGQQPNASFQKRLDELSTVNRRLAAYLLDRQLLLPLASDTKDILDFRLFIPQHRDDPTEVLQVTGGRYTCACQDGLLASAIDSVHHPSSSYRGNNSKSDNGINNSAVLLQRSYGHISISINSLQESEGNIWSVKGIRSAIGSASEREEFQINRVAVDSDSKVFVLTIKQIQAPPNSVSFEELLSGRAIAVDQKRRMELAFQLSSSVILLWTSHWLEVARYWKDWTASFSIDEDGDVCNIFLSPKSRPINPATRLRPEPMSVLTREPILTRLGLRLIELAFGRTLSELKREDGSMAQTEEEQRDQDVSDLLVAKRLLALRRICAEFGPNFESVVNICINQQYREYKGASIKELSFGDQSFLESAAVTILLPLYETVRRNFGCTCNAAKYNLVDRATLEVEDYQGVDDATLRDEQIVPYFNSEVQTSTKHRATDATIHERNQHMASSAQRRYGLSRTGNAETRDFGGTESAEVGFKERSVPQLYSISNVVGDQSFTDPTIPGQVKRMVEPNEEFAHPSSMQANPRSEVGKDTRQRQTVGPKNGTKVVNSKQQLLPPSQILPLLGYRMTVMSLPLSGTTTRSCYSKMSLSAC
ncbi:hypothetical protein BX600DRAFT_39658 [Xylariales sp. PMI_506]|nr:hypothetical protein BX600DRAFT_39658 [Xylariales sp. PMI_506]